MSMFKAGRGRGPAIHLFRVRGLEDLERAGVLEYDCYTGAPRGNYIVTSRGTTYHMDPPQVNAYIIATDDTYARCRQELAEILRDAAEEGSYDAAYAQRITHELDRRIGHSIRQAAEPFLAEQGNSPEDDMATAS